MKKFGIVKFSGKSGTRYAFSAYPLETAFSPGLAAVYVVTRRKEGGAQSGFVHKRICFGQSDDIGGLLAGDERPFSGEDANCICVHREKDKDARQKIEQDLTREPQAGNA